MGRLGAGMVKDEEETQAQNKVVFGLLFMLFIYSSAFFFLWAFMWYTPMGALGAAAIVWGFAVYHNRLIGGESKYIRLQFQFLIYSQIITNGTIPILGD